MLVDIALVVVVITIMAFFTRKTTSDITIDEMPSMRAFILTTAILLALLAVLFAASLLIVGIAVASSGVAGLGLLTYLFAVVAAVVAGLLTRKIMRRIVERRRNRSRTAR